MELSKKKKLTIEDITIVIVAYKSEDIIFKCVSYFKRNQKILILDNSNRLEKKKFSNKFKKLKVFRSSKNLGYAKGNNFLLNKVITEYALILNPDCLNAHSALNKVITNINKLNLDFALVGSKKNASIIKKNKFKNIKYFECDYIKGFFMLMEIKKLKKIKFFDKNFFMYLEEIDLCKRLVMNNEKIFAFDNLKIDHIGGKSSNDIIEYKNIQNWHWAWSQYYFYQKYNRKICALMKFLPKLLKYFFKKSFTGNKLDIIKFNGLLTSIKSKNSHYRG